MFAIFSGFVTLAIGGTLLLGRAQEPALFNESLFLSLNSTILTHIAFVINLEMEN